MQLTLVRHGEASPALDGNDSKRQLTMRGHQQAKQTAQYLVDKIKPDIFVVSTLVRAQETIAYIRATFPDIAMLVCDKIKPEDDAKIAVDWLSQLPFENIVVVCHMNVVAHIEEILTLESFKPFALAEARIYEQVVIGSGLSTEKYAFVPNVR